MGVRLLKMAVNGYDQEWISAIKRIGESVAGTRFLVFAVNVFLNVQETNIAVKEEAHSKKRGLTFD